MTAADSAFLELNCPNVLLALMAMQMLLNRIDQREETEKLLADTGNTIKREGALNRAKGLEETARLACHEMLRRIGTLPELNENFEMQVIPAPKTTRRKSIAPAPERQQDAYATAAARLGAV